MLTVYVIVDQATGRQPNLEEYVENLLGPYECAHPPTPTASYDERIYNMLRAYHIVRPHVMRHHLEVLYQYDADIDVSIFD